MKKEKAAVIYARMLLQAAEDNKASDAVSADMHILAQSFRNLPALHMFLTNPVRRAEEKAKVIGSVAAKLAPLTQKFLKLLETKNRFALLRPIADAYITLEEARKNILRATVVSAKPLAPDQLDKLTRGLEVKRPGKTYILTNQIDASLIAGFRIVQGDTITDASIKHKLDLLRQKLAA
ncbi:MAG: synthase subcomplex delta subunit [Fibrobacteres bacterium]|nr:synthase subcomplex delta subunit [Fibrobacterota bacterium]